jgi:sugar phosphate isomerase/epimerase
VERYEDTEGNGYQMSHRLGVSGSVILSNPVKYEELFWEGIHHIEIGEFPDEVAFKYFLALCQKKNTSFGIHSPLYRNKSKYDLLQRVDYEPEYAWDQLEHEAEQMSKLGADYLLVHFPYFKHEVDNEKNVNELIEKGLKKLDEIQRKYSIQLICEPKLGFHRSNSGISYLHNFPIETWEKYNLQLCIDIGDYLIATEDKIFNYIDKWKEHIKVVHLHNVEYKGDKYIWIPIHPGHERSGEHFQVEGLIKYLATCEDITFVFEHTPHSNPNSQFVNAGYQWIKSII